MNKRMQKLLLDGDCLKAGIARGDVFVVLIPPQSKRNDTKMKKRSGILYGSTIWTDEQIIYFYRKHDGNATAASKELRMHYTSYKHRLSKLGLSPKGKPRGIDKFYTDKQIRSAMKKAKGNKREAARILGCHHITMMDRAKALGLKAKGVGPTNNKYTDKQIRDAIKRAKGNFNQAAKILGCAWATIQIRAKKLELAQQGGNAGRKPIYTDKQIRSAMKKAKTHVDTAATLLGCTYKTMLDRARKLGLNLNKSGRR